MAAEQREVHQSGWVGGEVGGLLELPLTTIFTGALARFGPTLYPLTWRVPKLRGALARLGLLDRVPLTPEGVTVAEALRAIDAAARTDLPVLVLSFHSPSLRPGHTPYVRTEADLDDFYDWWRSVLARLGEHGILPGSVREVMSAVELA